MYNILNVEKQQKRVGKKPECFFTTLRNSPVFGATYTCRVCYDGYYKSFI